MITRSEERRETNWIALIRLDGGAEIPCTVKDVSKSGARLGVPGHVALPAKFMFRVIGRDFVCSVKMAWRRGDHVGVVIDQVGKLKPAPPKPEAPPQEAPIECAADETQRLQARRSRFSRY